MKTVDRKTLHRLAGISILLLIFLAILSVTALARETPGEEQTTPRQVDVRAARSLQPQATFVVNTTADGADGSCDPSPSDCTLREAIVAANASPGVDTIILPAGVHALTLTGAERMPP